MACGNTELTMEEIRMAGIKKKTKKAIIKPVTKLVQKHGAEAAIALVTGLIGGVAAASAMTPSGAKKASAGPKRGGKKASATKRG